MSNKAPIIEIDYATFLHAFRGITRSTDERTFLTGNIPRSGVGNSAPVIDYEQAQAVASALVLSSLNSLALDWTARLSVGGVNMNFFIVKQLPVLPPEAYLQEACDGLTFVEMIVPRVLELTFTTNDLVEFARELGWAKPPFLWDKERRFLLRCELDAILFHLYLPADQLGNWRVACRSENHTCDETSNELAVLESYFPKPRDAVAYIIDTFPIVRQKDEKEYGEYRTRRVVLEIYDAMQSAFANGESYQTRVDPPPADPACCHPFREAMQS